MVSRPRLGLCGISVAFLGGLVKRTWSLLVVGVVVSGLVGACGSSKHSSSGATTGSTSAAGGSATTVAAGGSSLTSSDVGVTPTSISIGYITSLTGSASSTFVAGVGGAQAAISAANAAGGVDGRQIKLVTLDDQSTPTGFDAAAEQMKSKGVFGVIPYSAFTFGGYKTLQQAGIPVAGNALDGPEWGQEPNSNMFTFLPPSGSAWGGQYYIPNWTGKILQYVGVKKPAGFAYGISPTSQAAAKAVFVGAPQTGLTKCYANYSVPFGGVDFTADVLQVKSLGCDAVFSFSVDATDQALATEVNQAGLTNVKKLFYTGYDQTTLATAGARDAFEGSYFASPLYFDPSIPQVGAMLNALVKYDSSYKVGTVPDYGTWGSYVSAQLMIYGLQQAGQNPTRKTFISNLRQVTGWDDNGLLPVPTPFTNFGTPQMLPASNCEYVIQLKNGAFVNAGPNGKPICAGTINFPAG